MLVFIGKLSLSALRWVAICPCFNNFLGFWHHFVLAKPATTSKRVKVSKVWRCASWRSPVPANGGPSPGWQFFSYCWRRNAGIAPTALLWLAEAVWWRTAALWIPRGRFLTSVSIMEDRKTWNATKRKWLFDLSNRSLNIHKHFAVGNS